ncbi:MAG TPA: glycosyltransferase family 4 protein [Aliidongia sp.]|uniref:glycosyltransferase family 4 protein n=1 Tax=Aliidongia sp. TaxID=1914230 RepID=UPI002DDD9CE4|nr:glycosyltransferase family 4 protein [Aliidongia sp.]HEV2677312.1 glycosyltransferase family 4 protein [Aliidongia sp.]
MTNQIDTQPPGRRLRAVLLPPFPWQPERDGWKPGTAPDPLELDRRLAAQGIDLVLLDPGERPWNPLAGGHSLMQSLDPLRALRVLTAWRDVDVAISVFEGSALPLELLRTLFLFRVPVVVWDLGLTDGWKLRERILDRVVPRAAGLFVLSDNQRSYIAERWGRSAGVEVIGHRVDTEFFLPAPPAPAGYILSVGEDAGRDFDCLIDVAPQIDADILLKTRRIPEDRVLPPRVKTIRQRIGYPELRDLYAQSRFVVVPLHETINASGVSIVLEASAMGRGMIVSDTAAMRDFIVPNETCLTVPSGDRAALAAAIQRLIGEPETCARLGAGARRFIEERCSDAAFADRFATVLRRYARRRRGDA